MELNVTVPLQILKGIGWLEFPEALKREPLNTQIRCMSLYFVKNDQAKREPLFVVCSGSFYYTHNHELKNNIVAMFQHLPVTHLMSSTYPAVPITMTQDKLVKSAMDHFITRYGKGCQVPRGRAERCKQIFDVCLRL